MKYFFVLGSNPTLSIAELSALFPNEIKTAKTLSNKILILDTPKFNPSKFIKIIGGTIKIGEIKKEINSNEIIKESINLINDIKKEGKFKFGISYYGKRNFKLLKTGLEIKKYLREKKISCRFVTSKEKTLSSVVVEQNKLINKGVEIILIQKNLPLSSAGEGQGEVLIGKTLAVQPFKELSYRDYGRPARDDHSGMLPPKLAQIMINFSGPSSPLPAKKRDRVRLLDPFCGSGTILTEAMIMGYKNLAGSDLSPKAIKDTKQNIGWIKKKFELKDISCELHEISATEIDKKIEPNSIDAIVTEPYLGPQRGKHDIQKTIKELENLYSQSLEKFAKILKRSGTIAMVWPIFTKATAGKPIQTYINPKINNFKIKNVIPDNLNKNFLTQRNTIVYGRPGQKVWREIVILEKGRE